MMGKTPGGVQILLIVTIVSFWPLQAGFRPWQLVSYAFLHANTFHLAVNMYGLWMFGSEMERLLGRRTFLQLYVASVLSAAVMQLLVMSISGSITPTVGASGGVFGLLLAYGMCFPNRIVVLLIPPIPMPARLFVILYAALELLLGVTGAQANVAHFAHLGGMVGGYLVIRQWRKRTRWL
jgi:membrane associated rhomboid family serine protease